MVPISLGKPPLQAGGTQRWGRKIPGLRVASWPLPVQKNQSSPGQGGGVWAKQQKSALGACLSWSEEGGSAWKCQNKPPIRNTLCSKKCPIYHLEGDTLQTKLFSLQKQSPSLVFIHNKMHSSPKQDGVSVTIVQLAILKLSCLKWQSPPNLDKDSKQSLSKVQLVFCFIFFFNKFINKS